MKTSFRVAVVGGGPAGSHLAYNLADQSVDVAVFVPSKQEEKACGGGVPLDCLKRYPIFKGSPFVDPQITHHLSRLTFVPSGEEIHVSCEPLLAIVKREQLDAFLLSKAEAAGATVIHEKVLNVLSSGKLSGWEVQTREGTYRADILVGADGVRSLVRRRTIGRIPPRHLALTVGYYLAGVPCENGLIAFVGTEGYLWIFPRLDGSASAGVVARLGSEKAGPLWSKLDRFLQQRYGRVHVLSRWTALLPAVCQPDFYAARCSGENWLLVGDAAGHVDPVWGAGIDLALESGWLAAKAIVRGDVGMYETMWRDSYGNLLATQSETAGKIHALIRLLSVQVFEYFLRKACQPSAAAGDAENNSLLTLLSAELTGAAFRR
jgi:geranylgeranyl reductase family protein